MKNKKFKTSRKIDDIEIIPLENIDPDALKNAEVIDDFKISNTANIKRIIIPFITMLAIVGVAAFIAYNAMTSVIVEGKVVGSKLELAGYSLVDKDYNPNIYMKPGYSIYYDTSDRGKFFKSKEKFNIGEITKVNDGTCYIKGPLKDTPIKFPRVNYVVINNQGS